MQKSRLFVSQETLDRWLTDERVEVDGDAMTLLPEQRRFQLVAAVHFLREVADSGDPENLVGKVREVADIVGAGGDHCQGSVVLGESAYEVVDGFLGSPVVEEVAAPESSMVGSSLEAAAAAALGDVRPPSGEFDLMSQFFLKSR